MDPRAQKIDRAGVASIPSAASGAPTPPPPPSGRRPAESTVTFGVKVIADQGHIHFDVFAGRTPHSRGRAGRLVLRADEFEEFVRLLGPEVVRYPIEDWPATKCGDPYDCRCPHGCDIP